MTGGPKPLPCAELEVPKPALCSAAPKPAWRKVAWLALLVGAMLVVVYLSPLRNALSHLREISAQIRGLGLLGPSVLTLGVAILVTVGFPRLLFCVIAGMAFGFWWGLLWAQLGTLLGNYALFLLARTTGREWAEHYLARRNRLHGLVREEGTWGVILVRQIPVPGLVVNLACGLVGVRHAHFLLGTAIGQLPEAIPFTLIGDGALQASFGKSAGLISLAVAVAVVLWVSLRRLTRIRRATPVG